MNVEPKNLSREAEAFLINQPWPGNVRELENTCRWLTVMAAGREILLSDLPPEMQEKPEQLSTSQENWEQGLRRWITQQLAQGNKNILATALPTFERTAIETALQHTAGHKRDAAVLLGWGRNTLTRKLQELEIQS